MKLTWTTILIFDVHFDVQFNGTPQLRDAVFNFEPLVYMYYIILRTDQPIIIFAPNKKPCRSRAM